jgi:hypothetical protein
MFLPIDLTNPNFLFDVIISHQRRLEALETSDIKPAADNTEKKAIAALEQWAHLFEVRNPNRGPVHFGERQAFLAGYGAAIASIS